MSSLDNFSKSNLEVVYTSPYVREVWHYKNAINELIRHAINEFNWQKAFLNINVNEKVDIFYSTILNILSTLKLLTLRVLKNLSVIERCPLLGGNLTKIVTFGTKCFVRYPRHVRYLECLLLGGFTVTHSTRICSM